MNQPKPVYTYRARVVRVIDGDTVVVDIDLGCHVRIVARHIRLARVAAPELASAEGRALAAQLMQRLPAGAEVVITTDLDKSEKYGRLLAEIWDTQGSVNHDMMQAVMMAAKGGESSGDAAKR